MPDVKRQRTSASGSTHRNVRAGSLPFRFAAVIRRRLLAFGSFLERSGERAIKLSLFRAGEFLKRPLPRRVRVHPTLATRTTGIAVAAIAHKVTPALEERGMLRSLRRRRRSLDSGLRQLRREPERAMPAVIAGLLSVAIIASLLPGPVVDARSQALNDGGGMGVGPNNPLEMAFATVWGETEDPDRFATDDSTAVASVTDSVLIGDIAPENSFSMRATEVVAQVPDVAVATTATDGPIFLNDGTLELPAAIDIAVADGRAHVQTHVVARGESIAVIARRYGISTMELIWSNNLQSANNPPAGKRLRVPDTHGVVVIVSENETLKTIASRYRVTSSVIYTYNNLKTADLVMDMILVIPGGRGAALPTYTTGGQTGYKGPMPQVYSGIKFKYPVPGGRFVRGLSRTHFGMDISQDSGRPVLAAADGVVVLTGWRNNCGGNQIVIAHGSNLYTGYYHLSGINISTGQKVSRGTQIGRIGRTGCSTGPHLHFSVSRGFPLASGSVFYDPARFLP